MSQRTYRKHIRAWYLRATPEQRFDGATWYEDGRAFVGFLAARFNLPIRTAAGVVAALSPRNKWERNKIDAQNFCRAWSQGEQQAPSASTFGANRVTAWGILHGTATLSGRKVTAFAANLSGDDDAVTVDVWAVRAATGGRLSTVPNDTVYRDVARAYRHVAAEVGVTPAQLQAIVWVAVRNEA